MDSKYDTNIENAKNDFDTKTNRKADLLDDIREIENKESKGEKLSDTEEAIKKEYETLKAGKDVKGSVAYAEEQVKIAEKAKQDAIEEVKTNIQDEIDAKVKELDALRAKQAEQKLDEADGSKLQRTSDTSFNKKLEKKKNGEDVEFTKGDMRYLINCYRDADGEDKYNLGQQFMDIWNDWGATSSNRSGFLEAYKIIKRDMEEYEKKQNPIETSGGGATT